MLLLSLAHAAVSQSELQQVVVTHDDQYYDYQGQYA